MRYKVLYYTEVEFDTEDINHRRITKAWATEPKAPKFKPVVKDLGTEEIKEEYM